MLINRVTAPPDDLPQLAQLAAAEGFGMLEVLARDWADGSNRFTAAGEALFVARGGDGCLLGIGGITQDPWA